MDIKKLFKAVFYMALDSEEKPEKNVQERAVHCYVSDALWVMEKNLRDCDPNESYSFYKALEDISLAGESEVALRMICIFLTLFGEQDLALKVDGLILRGGIARCFMTEFVRRGLMKQVDY